MFEKYDEIMQVFDNYLLKSIDSSNFEIKGSIQTLRNAITDLLGVGLPIIMNGDKQLIHSSIKQCLDAKRESEFAYRTFYAKRRRTLNDKSAELQDAKVISDKKMLEYGLSKMELEKTCEKYSHALCIVIYDGILTLEILEKLEILGYDGSYGNDNLKLMYKLYIENKNLKAEVNNVRLCNIRLLDEVTYYNNKSENYEMEISNLKKELNQKKKELDYASVVAEYYKDELDDSKKYVKKNNVSNSVVRIYGK